MDRVCVLVAASGAGWESTALSELGSRPGIVVLKRCVDVNDLLATATTGQADVAVVALDVHGLDAVAVEHLRRHRVRPVVVTGDPGSEPARARMARIGVTAAVAESGLDRLPDAVLGAPEEPLPEPDAPDLPEPIEGGGRVVAVWGPAGAPGRTTVAIGLAAELARRGGHTLLVDADPWGGSVAQHLGILDEVSGLLSAARLSTAGDLEGRFHTVQRRLHDGLDVLTGLPRAERYVEVRAGVVEHLVDVGRARAHVVLDTGFALEDEGADFGSVPSRNAMTLGAITTADEVVVVGSADPVGLSRLARGLVELREVTGGLPVRVVVNRMRPSLGWSERDIAGMVEGFTRLRGLHFLPEDRVAVDRALVAGRTLVETGESALSRALAGIVDGVAPDLPAPAGARTRVRRRTTGTARRR